MNWKNHLLLLIVVAILLAATSVIGSILNSVFGNFSLIGLILFIVAFYYFWKNKKSVLAKRAEELLEEAFGCVSHTIRKMPDMETGRIAANVIALFRKRLELVASSRVEEQGLKIYHGTPDFTSIVTISKEGELSITICCQESDKEIASKIRHCLKEVYGISKRLVTVKISKP